MRMNRINPEDHVKLVMFTAQRLSRRHYPRITRKHLWGPGYLGLLRAVEKFDASKGFQFSTYASFWIARFIHEYIRDVCYGGKRNYDICMEIARAETKLGPETNERSVAEHIGTTEAMLRHYRKRLSAGSPLNGDYHISVEDDFTFFDACLRAFESDRPDEAVQCDDLIAYLERDLIERDLFIFRQRFLIGKSVNEIAQSLRLGRQRVHVLVRRLRVNAIRKLAKDGIIPRRQADTAIDYCTRPSKIEGEPGEVLRRLRENSGISQVVLDVQMGIPRTLTNRLERGARTITRRTAAIIEDFFCLVPGTMPTNSAY